MFKSCKANLGNTNALFKICSNRAEQASPVSDTSLSSKFPSPTSLHTFPEVLCVHSPAAHPELKNQITLSTSLTLCFCFFVFLIPPSFSHLPSSSGSLSDKRALCNEVLKPPRLGAHIYPTCTWGLQCGPPRCRRV